MATSLRLPQIIARLRRYAFPQLRSKESNLVPQGVQALAALLVLLPGFLSARFVRMLSAKSQQTELERIIEALIFSFLTYVLYIFLFGASLPVEWTSTLTGGTSHYAVSVHRFRVMTLLVISVVIGVGWGYVKGHDLLLNRLRRWGLTKRSSRDSVWVDVFLNHGGTVQVGLGDGRTVSGWLKQYSESGDERTLLLVRAMWIVDDVEPVPVPGDGTILLTEKSEIKYVMFLDEGK